eukprot:Gb_23892 [translate_table: standard]
MEGMTGDEGRVPAVGGGWRPSGEGTTDGMDGVVGRVGGAMPIVGGAILPKVGGPTKGCRAHVLSAEVIGLQKKYEQRIHYGSLEVATALWNNNTARKAALRIQYALDHILTELYNI